MKKSTLFIACCIGLMLFASCKKDPIAPTIDIFEGWGYVTENAQVYSGDEILVGFTGTGENLTQIEIVLSQNGTVLANHTGNLDEQKADPVSPYTYKATFTLEVTGAVTITGTVTDANGLTASKSFNVIFNEKPNAKFIGHYEGDALFTGVMKTEIDGMDPLENELTDSAFPVTLELSDGGDINKVTGICKINDQEMEIQGTVEGNKVTFEAVNTTVSFNYEFNGFNIPLNMNITYAVTGVLDQETLSLDGTCNGGGEVHVFLYNGTTSIEGTIGGSLVKQ